MAYPNSGRDDQNATPPGLIEMQQLIRTSLRLVSETLTMLEHNALDGQPLDHPLPRYPQQQSDALSNYRQSILNLLHASTPEDSIARAHPVQLRIHCFGPFEVERNEECIPLHAGKGSAILKFLALQPKQPTPRDVLLEALWPQTEPNVANNRLKVAMHHLRQAFVTKGCSPRCEGCVVFRDGCYGFNPAIDVWTDVQAFEHAWQTGARLERAGHQIEAIPHYLEAESLYRGDLLAEDRYEEWTLLRRQELQDAYLTLLEKLSRYWLQIGNPEDAIAGWKKILARDPWREDIYRHIIACSAYRGQRGLALRWYETCMQALQTQLHLDPEPETVALHRRILDGGDVSEWMNL